MNYKITVIDANGGEFAYDSKAHTEATNALKKLEIKVDTVDENVSDRSSKVLNKLELQLLINSGTKDFCHSLMKWSLEFSNALVHREVKILITDSTGETVRAFDLQHMFVEDYAETYSDNGDVSALTLKLIQRAGHSAEFEHDVEDAF